MTACPDCDGDGIVLDPDACGDPDHCPQGMTCPRCEGAGQVLTVSATPPEWDVLEPVELCSSPDGHERHELRKASSYVPAAVLCPRCGREWTVLTFTEGRP